MEACDRAEREFKTAIDSYIKTESSNRIQNRSARVIDLIRFVAQPNLFLNTEIAVEKIEQAFSAAMINLKRKEQDDIEIQNPPSKRFKIGDFLDCNFLSSERDDLK